MNLTKVNDVNIISGSVEEFSLKFIDTYKKNVKNHSTYTNANFFGGYKEGKEYFTLPVNHLIADWEAT